MPPMLFTGKGDGGTTKTLKSGEPRVSKSSVVPEALGALDELNSFIGFVKVRAAGELRIFGLLRETQEALFVVQAELAGASKCIAPGTVERVEHLINEIEKKLPPITSFTIVGGTELSALLDVARTIARRTERRAIAAAEAGRAISAPSRAFLNRLSSLFFALARLVNHDAGILEESPHY